MPLTGKQRLFVGEYLVDLNATQAALRAGYSKKTAYSQGQRLLKHVEVSGEIAKRTEKRAEKLELSADYVLGGLKELVERCIQAQPIVDKEGKETGEYKFEAHAALKGYELLGKHLKLFTDKVEHFGEVTIINDLPTPNYGS